MAYPYTDVPATRSNADTRLNNLANREVLVAQILNDLKAMLGDNPKGSQATLTKRLSKFLDRIQDLEAWVEDADGSKITVSSSDPSGGKEGDVWIKTSGGNPTKWFTKTGSGWGSGTSLVGAKGDDGDEGPPGGKGNKGDDGKDGAIAKVKKAGGDEYTQGTLTFSGSGVTVTEDAENSQVVVGIAAGDTLAASTVSGASCEVDVGAGTVHVLDVSGTGDLAITLVGAAESAPVSLSIVVRQGADVRALTWEASVHWDGGTAPVFTANKTSILGLFTVDGGATWWGAQSIVAA